MIILYTNCKYIGKWDNQGANHNKVVIALATDLKQERANNKNSPSNRTSSATKTPATDPGNSTGPPAWEFKNFGKTTTCCDTGAK